MSEWFETQQGLWERAWSLMNGKDGAAYATLATVGAGGAPEARLLMLRGADPKRGELVLHTDATTRKVQEMRDNPRVALHFWSRGQDLQLRAKGTAHVITGEPLSILWRSLPDHNRLNYGVTPPPGTVITGPDAYQRIENFDQFAVITLIADEIDVVHLSPDFHRRVYFRREDNWAGQWCAP